MRKGKEGRGKIESRGNKKRWRDTWGEVKRRGMRGMRGKRGGKSGRLEGSREEQIKELD